ncbi:iron hydrogenase [Chytriomyces sp. MP71]|nr:iron hydrogenase [Chytriomyces sp. MP71]
MTFSGVLQVTDLDDFIGASQACIKPVEVKKDENAKESTIKRDGLNYYEVSVDGTETQLEAAKITLNDCLACSGCITSAESILVASQSHQDVYTALAGNASCDPVDRKTIVISLSPQSRASFAAKYNLSPLSVHKRLVSFFVHSLGCDYVVDASFARDFSLVEGAREFVRRYRSVNGSAVAGSSVLPMLASACPGWICYAEKTHDYILPNISTTKSPQQVMGTLLKTYVASALGLQSMANLYHVSVMPCYDKKLEASRADFYNDVFRTRDVDTVITTGEVERMLREKGVSLPDLPESPLPSLLTRALDSSAAERADVMDVEEEHGVELTGTEGSSSGGYLSYTFRYAARELFGVHLSPADVEAGAASAQLDAEGRPAWSVLVKPGRNVDFGEMVLRVGEEEVLRFAKAYGFRNIQNLVRKAKPVSAAGIGPIRGIRSSRMRATKEGSDVHHFVEVMACPSGCINGGGQLKPDVFDANGVAVDSGPASKDYVNHAEAVNWLGGIDSEKSRELLHTQYHAISKLTEVNGLNVKW